MLAARLSCRRLTVSGTFAAVEPVDAVPRLVRRAVYLMALIAGLVLFVLMSLAGSGLVHGELVGKWVAFLTALTAAPAGALGLAYSKGK